MNTIIRLPMQYFAEGGTEPPAQPPAVTTPPPAAPGTQPAQVDMDAITQTAERQAEKKAQSVVRDMLKQSGLDDALIGEMLTEFKAKRQTPEQLLETERQQKAAYQGKYESLIKQTAIQKGLETMGAKPGMAGLLSKAVDLAAITLDGDSAPDVAKLLEPLKTAYPDAFTDDSAGTPPPTMPSFAGKTGGTAQPKGENDDMNNILRSVFKRG